MQFDDGRQEPSGGMGAGPSLPQSVKIALTVLDEKNRVHEFQTRVPLGCRRALPRPAVATEAGKR